MKYIRLLRVKQAYFVHHKVLNAPRQEKYIHQRHMYIIVMGGFVQSYIHN
jgi:hypothetical protein